MPLTLNLSTTNIVIVVLRDFRTSIGKTGLLMVLSWSYFENFSFTHLGHLGDSLLSPCQGGRGVDKICAILNFPGGFVVFLSSLTSEERVSKQLKQVPSILGRITLLIPTTLKKCAKQKNIPKKQTQQKLVSYDLQIVDTSRLQKNSPNKKMFFSAF